jgi:hypothetical protein
MAVTNPPMVLTNAGATHTAEMFRNAYGIGLTGARAASSLVPRGGVQPALGTQLAVTQQGSPTMGITVGTGLAVIPGTEDTDQGAYIGSAPTTTNVAVTAAHASLARIDLVVFRVYDSAYSGASNTSALEVIAGTAGSGSPPSTPNNSLILAQIAVGAAVSSIVNANITDRRAFLGGGIIPVATVADLPAVGVYDGMMCYVRSEDTLYTYDGSAWGRPPNTHGAPTGYLRASTDTGSIGTSEGVFMTLPSATYKANTAYSVEFFTPYDMSTTTNYPTFAMRKTNVAGAIITDFFRGPVQVGGSGQPNHFYGKRYFIVGGSDVTAVLVGTTRAFGGSVVIRGSGTTPRAIEIREAGKAADYTGWPTLV